MSDYANDLQRLLQKKSPPPKEGWKTIVEIAKEEGLSIPTVRGMVNEFVSAGWWEIAEGFYAKNKSGAWQKMKYYRKKK